MRHPITATFGNGFAKLTGDNQKVVKNRAFELPIHPTGSGLSLHWFDRVKVRIFWLVRVTTGVPRSVQRGNHPRQRLASAESEPDGRFRMISRVVSVLGAT